MTDTGKTTIETLQRLVDAFNAHDLDAVMSWQADSPASPTSTTARTVTGSAATGLLGVAAHRDDHPGDRVEVRGCDLFEFRGDKIARKDSYWKLVER